MFLLYVVLLFAGCSKSGDDKQEGESIKDKLNSTKWNMLFNGQSYGTITFNSDGSCLKTAEGMNIETNGTWKYENDKLTLSFPNEGEPFSGSVNADGENLIVKLMDGAITYTYTPAQTGIPMIGKVVSVEDSGLGPFEGITIEDQSSGNSIYFLVEVGKYKNKAPDGNLVGKFVKIKYVSRDLQRITNLMLRSEHENAAAQAHVYIAGEYVSGEVGDMGSYITIKNSEGKNKQYTGTFEVDAANSEKYKGKEVILYYEETVEYDLLDLEVINK
jgi:hypothetical protein